jgi:hypothetical protein
MRQERQAPAGNAVPEAVLEVDRPGERHAHSCCAAGNTAARSGEKADNEFAAGVEVLGNPRDLGYEGIILDHMGFDGALFSALKRRFLQWKDAQYDPDMHPTIDAAKLWLLQKRHLSTFNHCVEHVMALGFHKGLMPIEGHKAKENSYLVAEACRNSFALMLSVLYGWLPKVLAFGAQKKER